MANCPNCGSEHIQLRKDTNVDWGRAIAGYAVLGVVGGAVGAVTGEDRNANACLDCGTSWKASNLYQTRQLIKKKTGYNLDLSRDKHRNFLNSFVSEVTPFIEAIQKAEEEAKAIEKNAKSKTRKNRTLGCMFGILVGIGGYAAIAASVLEYDLALLIFGTLFLISTILIGNFVGSIIDSIKKDEIEGIITKEREKAKLIREDAKRKLRIKISGFVAKHSL